MNIVIPGSPHWLEIIRPILSAHDAVPVTQIDSTNLIAVLADLNAALLLIDGELSDWRTWAVTPRTSPAARRIPIVVITDDAATTDSARRFNVDRIVSAAELPSVLPDLLTTLARRITAEQSEALKQGCAEPLPPEALEAIERFNRGDYYKQHDLFEALWMQETRPIRDLYRAVLQVGIAYYQIEQGNWRGAHKMLLRSIQWLVPLPDHCQGIDLGALKADAAAVRAELERVGRDNLAAFDRSLLKPIRYTVD